MPLQLLNLMDIAANQANWDADLQDNIDAIKGALRVWKGTITVQGGVGSPSTITWQLQDANGTPLSEQVYLRVRLVNSATDWTVTNGTIAVGGSTTLIETITADKDLVVRSTAAGLVTITYTNANAVTRTLMVGPAPVMPAFANHNNSQDITHA